MVKYPALWEVGYMKSNFLFQKAVFPFLAQFGQKAVPYWYT